MNHNTIEKTRELNNLYPIEANYCSKSSLWGRALNDGVVTQDEFNEARKYYGSLWFYTGD